MIFSKTPWPGDTCLLIPWITLPYHTSMAHLRPGLPKLGSPLSPRARIPRQADPWRESPEVRKSPWIKVWKVAQNGPKRPGMAHPVYPFPIWTAAHIRATGTPSDPSSRYETAQSGPKWRGNQKIALSEDPKSGEDPLTGPCFRLSNRSLNFPLPGNLAAAGHQANGNALWGRPIVPAPEGYSNREKGRFPLVRQLNAYCRNQNAIALGLSIGLAPKVPSCIMITTYLCTAAPLKCAVCGDCLP